MRWSLALLLLSAVVAGCAGQCAPDVALSVASAPFEETYWRAVSLGGQPVPSQDARREAHLQFTADGRVSGSDGCNRVMGSYERKDSAITFGPVAGTKMACSDTAATERAFNDALTRATRYAIVDQRLQLFAGAGPAIAVFEARANAPAGK